jgi:hypothetical protein
MKDKWKQRVEYGFHIAMQLAALIDHRYHQRLQETSPKELQALNSEADALVKLLADILGRNSGMAAINQLIALITAPARLGIDPNITFNPALLLDPVA